MRRELRCKTGRSKVFERTTTLAGSPGDDASKLSQSASDHGVQQVRLSPDRIVDSMGPDRDPSPLLWKSAWLALPSWELVRHKSIVEKFARDTRGPTVQALNQGDSIDGQRFVHTSQPSPWPRVLVVDPAVPGRPGTPGRRPYPRAVRAAAVALGLGATAAISVFIAWTPWPVGFGLAIACAAALCIWLQRHPD